MMLPYGMSLIILKYTPLNIKCSPLLSYTLRYVDNTGVTRNPSYTVR